MQRIARNILRNRLVLSGQECLTSISSKILLSVNGHSDTFTRPRILCRDCCVDTKNSKIKNRFKSYSKMHCISKGLSVDKSQVDSSLPEDNLENLPNFLNIPPSRSYSTATFNAEYQEVQDSSDPKLKICSSLSPSCIKTKRIDIDKATAENFVQSGSIISDHKLFNLTGNYLLGLTGVNSGWKLNLGSEKKESWKPVPRFLASDCASAFEIANRNSIGKPIEKIQETVSDQEDITPEGKFVITAIPISNNKQNSKLNEFFVENPYAGFDSSSSAKWAAVNPWNSDETIPSYSTLEIENEQQEQYSQLANMPSTGTANLMVASGPHQSKSTVSTKSTVKIPRGIPATKTFVQLFENENFVGLSPASNPLLKCLGIDENVFGNHGKLAPVYAIIQEIPEVKDVAFMKGKQFNCSGPFGKGKKEYYVILGQYDCMIGFAYSDRMKEAACIKQKPPNDYGFLTNMIMTCSVPPISQIEQGNELHLKDNKSRLTNREIDEYLSSQREIPHAATSWATPPLTPMPRKKTNSNGSNGLFETALLTSEHEKVFNENPTTPFWPAKYTPLMELYTLNHSGLNNVQPKGYSMDPSILSLVSSGFVSEIRSDPNDYITFEVPTVSHVKGEPNVPSPCPCPCQCTYSVKTNKITCICDCNCGLVHNMLVDVPRKSSTDETDSEKKDTSITSTTNGDSVVPAETKQKLLTELGPTLSMLNSETNKAIKKKRLIVKQSLADMPNENLQKPKTDEEKHSSNVVRSESSPDEITREELLQYRRVQNFEATRLPPNINAESLGPMDNIIMPPPNRRDNYIYGYPSMPLACPMKCCRPTRFHPYQQPPTYENAYQEPYQQPPQIPYPYHYQGPYQHPPNIPYHSSYQNPMQCQPCQPGWTRPAQPMIDTAENSPSYSPSYGPWNNPVSDSTGGITNWSTVKAESQPNEEPPNEFFSWSSTSPSYQPTAVSSLRGFQANQVRDSYQPNSSSFPPSHRPWYSTVPDSAAGITDWSAGAVEAETQSYIVEPPNRHQCDSYCEHVSSWGSAKPSYQPTAISSLQGFQSNQARNSYQPNSSSFSPSYRPWYSQGSDSAAGKTDWPSAGAVEGENQPYTMQPPNRHQCDSYREHVSSWGSAKPSYKPTAISSLQGFQSNEARDSYQPHSSSFSPSRRSWYSPRSNSATDITDWSSAGTVRAESQQYSVEPSNKLHSWGSAPSSTKDKTSAENYRDGIYSTPTEKQNSEEMCCCRWPCRLSCPTPPLPGTTLTASAASSTNEPSSYTQSTYCPSTNSQSTYDPSSYAPSTADSNAYSSAPTLRADISYDSDPISTCPSCPSCPPCPAYGPGCAPYYPRPCPYQCCPGPAGYLSPINSTTSADECSMDTASKDSDKSSSHTRPYKSLSNSPSIRNRLVSTPYPTYQDWAQFLQRNRRVTETPMSAPYGHAFHQIRATVQIKKSPVSPHECCCKCSFEQSSPIAATPITCHYACHYVDDNYNQYLEDFESVASSAKSASSCPTFGLDLFNFDDILNSYTRCSSQSPVSSSTSGPPVSPPDDDTDSSNLTNGIVLDSTSGSSSNPEGIAPSRRSLQGRLDYNRNTELCDSVSCSGATQSDEYQPVARVPRKMAQLAHFSEFRSIESELKKADQNALPDMKYYEKGLSQMLADLGITKLNKGSYAGEWIGSDSLQPAVDPSIGCKIADVAMPTCDEIEHCIRVAKESSNVWMHLPAPCRAVVLREISSRLRDNRESLAKLISMEVGKVLVDATCEVRGIINMFDYAAGLAAFLPGNLFESERANHIILERFFPMGVAGVISAFNTPVSTFGKSAAISLAVGNSVVYKPAITTSLTSIALMKIVAPVFEEFKLPPIVTCIQGFDNTGRKLADDSRIDILSFSGNARNGHDVGMRVQNRFGKSLLNLTGNNGMIINHDANFQLALNAATLGVIDFAGQKKQKISRIIVHRNLYDRFVEELVKMIGKVTKFSGHPLDPKTIFGPLHTAKIANEFMEAVNKIRDSGGKIEIGGEIIRGNFVQPTIVTNVECNSDLMAYPILGPIAFITPASDIEDAIEINNSYQNCMQSSVFSKNVGDVLKFIGTNGLSGGVISVNTANTGSELTVPFGGDRAAGGGRLSGSNVWREYCRRMAVTINFSSSLPYAHGSGCTLIDKFKIY